MIRRPSLMVFLTVCAILVEHDGRAAARALQEAQKLSPQIVFRVTTSLVQFDAQVFDPDGNLVVSLTPSDFLVLQDGVPVELKDVTFVERRLHAIGSASSMDRAPMTGIDVEPVVFLVDDMAMTPSGFERTRKGLRAFVSPRLPPGIEVGILRTGETGRRTTELTASPDVLLQRIADMRYLARSLRSGLASGSGASAPGGPELERTFVEGTLGSLTSLLVDLRRLPGRKVVVLLSEGVAIDMGDGDNSGTSLEHRMNRLGQLAAVAGVTTHCIDVAGVQGAPSSLRLRTSLRDGLVSIAERTGGRYFDGKNDLTTAVSRLATMERGYYLLSYEPPSGTFVNGKPAPFRRLTVKVRRKGMEVRTRSGFFGAGE